jgi:hypothetical protein
MVQCSVADPHSFHPDPGLNDQKLKKKITAEKKIKFFWIKNYNLPIPRPL